MAELFLIPALIMGAAIGIVELVFVHADERGMGWLGHGLHALPIMMILTFIAMNLEWAFGIANLSLQSNLWIDLGVRIVLGLVAAFKVKAAAAIVKGQGGVGEKLSHALIIGGLIAASPYIWVLIAPFLPAFLGGVPSAPA